MVYNPTLRLVKGDELTWEELDDNFVQLQSILANTATLADLTPLTANVASLDTRVTILETTPALPTGTANGDFIRWSATSSAWVIDSNVSTDDTKLSVIGWNSATGDLTITDTAGGSFIANLDGRYALEDKHLTSLTYSDATTTLSATLSDGTVVSSIIDGFVNITGDMMTGPLILNANPVNPLGAATKQYVDNLSTVYVNVSGDTLTGPLVLYGAPTSPLEATTKDYVDTLVSGYVSLGGDTMTGMLTLSGDPTSNLHAATKQYVDSIVLSANTYSTAQFNVDFAASSLGNLSDVSVAGALPGQTLTWDGIQWSAATPSDVVMSAIAYDPNTHVLTATISNGTIFTTTIDIDTDTVINGLTYDSNTGTLTATVSDGSSVSTVLPNTDTTVSNILFDINNGRLTIDLSDGNQHITSIDGRYAQTVNGIGIDGSGNIAISITETQTGTFSARPASANSGVVYVVSGEANTSLNGQTWIYVDGSGWQEVKGFDQAAADARYVNVAGDTMTGVLTLSGDPTSNLHAATKQYVDMNSLPTVNTGEFITWNGTDWVGTVHPGYLIAYNTSDAGIETSYATARSYTEPLSSAQKTNLHYYNTNDKTIRVWDNVSNTWQSIGGNLDAVFSDLGNKSGGVILDPSGNTRSFKITMTGNVTVDVIPSTTMPAGYEYGLTLRVVGNGGTLNWSNKITWLEGVAPSNPLSGETCMYVLSSVDQGASWQGNYVGAY